MSELKIFWTGTVTKCNCCGAAFGTVMYDARMPGMGWGNFCHSCFLAHGLKLGTGKGQKYRRASAKERFYKVEG